MTVQQLVEHLHTLNPDALVYIKGEESWNNPLIIKNIENYQYRDQINTPLDRFDDDSLPEEGTDIVVL